MRRLNQASVEYSTDSHRIEVCRMHLIDLDAAFLAIRFDACKMRRLNRALKSFTEFPASTSEQISKR